MSKRKDIETLRRAALQRQRCINGEEPGSPWVGEDAMRRAAMRLFLGDGDPLITFAGSDLAELRRELDEVPMTTGQRVRVNRRLNLLQSAMETETPEAEEGERHAERAIETLTEYLGGIDTRWHNYQAAADQALERCKCLQRIANRCAVRSGTWENVAEQAIEALSKLKDHARIIEIKERWRAAAAAENDQDDIARHKLLGVLQALRKALLPPPFEALPNITAYDEIIELLNHLLNDDDEIPF
jgi:hypothetical protein